MLLVRAVLRMLKEKIRCFRSVEGVVGEQKVLARAVLGVLKGSISC